ncbi:CLUMA_CG019110, isoform B [Clunio marinus]|uniref:Nuclear protein MDM1 n=1 Tax=Clunio marinus TaxID=568069 RepID=A0A1J1J3E7_9DIPT|nr:CLUMA_CG019110, isoform B [Clunio marinus]
MIGTFFNLCRACPSSMPLDKLHSEYRSTYRWHEYTAGPEVVRKPPMPNHFIINAPINEPPLPRRKKCPELAYRHHEFIADSNADRTDSNVTRARAGESSGIFRKTISKLSTEYRLQFVWPSVRKVTGPSNKDKDNQILLEPPKKSQSMGALKSSQTNTLAGIHKKRTTNEEKEAAVHELEPLVGDVVDSHEKKDIQNEYRKNFKSAFHSEKEKFGFEQDASNKVDNKVVANGCAYDPSWYKEVIELRKKAGEYRNRGWKGETQRELYNKQAELWDQVSRRSSLSALSLASSIRPITKEDKERENKNKSSPTKPSGRRFPGSARLVDNRTITDGNLYGRLKRETIRHHLERTTGPDVEEGALLPSPTREKLMPVLPRSKTGSPQRGSPQKTISSRHGSPMKGSPQKSPKKISKVGRSQSVGPTVTDGGSPKKQPKPMSASITAATTSSAAKAYNNRKTPVSTPTATADHQPRPIPQS